MATPNCKDFQIQFELPSDAPRGDASRDLTAQAHLRDCPECRSYVEDLGAIRSLALEFAASEPEPPAHIWSSLRAQLEREGLIRNTPSKSWLSEFFSGRFSALPRPALAGAYLAALLAVAFGLSGPINSRINRQRWLDGTQSSTTPLSAQLLSAEQASFSSRPESESPVTASFHKNLDIVDNYISLCENSVREEPDNEEARDFLYEAYQQKADLLSQMNERRPYSEAPAQ
ncbi:MAG: hypothetical protein ACRD59_06255 [Candidatus Acidiferrales bacterium]